MKAKLVQQTQSKHTNHGIDVSRFVFCYFTDKMNISSAFFKHKTQMCKMW